ncbi:hypothetical protein NLU13_6194 [Sarocladium strictum]|uniref:[histone H3]-trimethyl-L-lysine(9) demethylase n=1 Tax=Sarocladium strictum TaxID=5046 RepID=A0AA39L6W8_SARSR|nr:hypothetical protein NLU13_6194 [Sarocladium strictum]
MSPNAHGAPSEAEVALPIEAQSFPEPSQGDAPSHDSICDDKHDTAAVQDDKTNSTPPFLHSPPDSNNAPKSDASDSELSDLEDDPTLDGTSLPCLQPPAQGLPAEAPAESNEEPEDIGEVLPDHWSGAVPIFKPTMDQFKDFQQFMLKVDSYGMKSGIIKIIPPKEWKDAQPPLDDLVKQVRVREPIKQDIMGSNGTYRQVNILHGRSYNVPQWRQLCEKSEHQPPARRGERRANADQPKSARPKAPAPKPTNPSTPKKRARGRPAKARGRKAKVKEEERPMTPVSPKAEPADLKEKALTSIEKDLGEDSTLHEQAPLPRRMGGLKPQGAKTQSVSARRKFSRREGSAMIDEESFKDFDYRLDTTEYTPERCEELERSYWKTLTYAQPLYGADMMGTLFDDRTEIWNLNKLPNILDVLGTKVPGVNTAYLYLGMWKATFAWHLEDVDLYSINYLHFGAPKQWYSISQADAKRFEGAMKNIWPADAKACPQFLRHKGFLISPQHLLQNYNIKVNKVVSYPGEFVVTYPYGYHSGYNLGYNCAEAVNFALEPWLEMGKIAKKCECAQAQDSVWIDVHAIERKLRGEETEYEETEDEEEEDDDDDEDDDLSGLPSPPTSHGLKFKEARKRKRGPGEKGPRVKKIKLRFKTKAEPPCCLCPNDYAGLDLLPTEDGRKAHRTCALYIPETYIDLEGDEEIVYGTKRIHKDRLSLKCLYCRSKRGACFQCSQKKCARAYHASCAAAAGVFVEEGEVPVFGEDGTEYKEQAFEFSCRFHRTKRDKKMDPVALEDDARIRKAAAALKVGDLCQMQLYRGEIFAGFVVENRSDEQMLLLDIVPTGQRMEVEWKWLLLPDPADYHLPKASSKAIPLPTSQKAKDRLNTKRADDMPRKDDVFGPGLTWAEYNYEEVYNKEQAKVDFEKQDQVWHYLGKTSTEARAQYTEDPAKPRFNPKGSFLDTLPKPPPKPRPMASHLQYRQYQGAGPSQNGNQFYPGSHAYHTAGTGLGKPYMYKPKVDAIPTSQFVTQRFVPNAALTTPSVSGMSPNGQTPYPGPGQFAKQTFEVKSQHAHLQQPVASLGQQHMSSKWRVAMPGAASQAAQHQHTASTQQQQRAQGKPSWQVHSSIYQKYPFFNSNHNRDSSKYRTPYSPAGGFTNGWEGSYDIHALSGQADRTSATATVSGQGIASHWSAQSQMLSQTLSRPHGSAPNGVHTQQAYPVSSRVATESMSPIGSSESSNAAKPPPPLKQAVLGLANTALKATKTAALVPSKQTPVPLPPNIMAAMRTSSASSPQSAASQITPVLSRSSPLGAKSPRLLTGTALTPSPGASKISTSPVPIPTFSAVTSDQHTAQAKASVAPHAPGKPSGGFEQMTANKHLENDVKIQAFPDVPAESMEFVERLMGNLRRVSQHNGI